MSCRPTRRCGLSNPVERLSLATRLANALVSYAAYLGQSFYPVDLSPYYPHLGTRLPIAWAAGALVLLVAITAVAAYCWRRLPYLLVGWLWFLGTLVPVIGLVPVGAHARADRYTYLSQIGLSIALAWGVWSVYRSRQSRQAATLAAMDARGRIGSGGVGACRRRVASNFLLAQCRDALDAYALLHRAESAGSL